MSVNPAMSFLKYLDQPLLLKKVNNLVPVVLPATGAVVVISNTASAPHGEKRKTFVRDTSVMATTIGAALWAARLFIHLDPHDAAEAVETIYKALKQQEKPISPELILLLKKAQSQILKPGEVHTLRKIFRELLADKQTAAEWLNHIIPEPVNEGAKKILGEIRDLSMLGLFPVVGGIIGGVIGNVLNRDHWKQHFKDQAKEGLYQYLSNILLCNIGAAVLLLALEKTPFANNRVARLGGMLTGIAFFGVWGGSTIANFLGKNFFNPICDNGWGSGMHQIGHNMKTGGVSGMFHNLNDERHPEVVDVAIHIDDLATVGVLSGLKWIMPALPFLYTFSGYRAGIGYRNGDTATLKTLPPPPNPWIGS